jgi:NADH dehydrogenase/NADH:ubiquinone oxidoreductase subunit G
MKLQIDNIEVEVEKGVTILEAAKRAGIEIPTLCYDKRLKAYGACRICVVEVEGARAKFTPSCTTEAQDGMKVRTQSDEIREARKVILELLLISHPLDCPVCDKGGECRLQDLVYEYGVDKNRFSHQKREHLIDYISPYIERNPNRCILCAKCVRACRELAGRSAISLVNRGIEAEVSTFFSEPLSCDFCGICIDICPVGALISRPAKFKARTWELEDTEALCPFCNLSCELIVRKKDGKIVTTKPADGRTLGILCKRAHFDWELIYSEDRLKVPLAKKDGKLCEISWDEALALIAERIEGAVIGLTSDTLNEELKLTKEFAEKVGAECVLVDRDPILAEFKASFEKTGSPDISELLCYDAIVVIKGVEETSPVALYLANLMAQKGTDVVFAEPDNIKLPRSETPVIYGGSDPSVVKKVAGLTKNLFLFARKLNAVGAFNIIENSESKKEPLFLATYKREESAKILLPLAMPWEKEGTITDFSGNIREIKKVCEPQGSCRSLTSVISELAKKMGIRLSK